MEIMGFNCEESFTMAERLKQLREEKGLSHDKLSKALCEQYGVKISSDSLINYEVADVLHAKAYKNQGMRVEYLRCLADFYSVSADYLLGISDVKSPDISVKSIVEQTGLSEPNVISLQAWNSIATLIANNSTSRHPPIVDKIMRSAKMHKDPERLGKQVCDIVNRLVSSMTDHPRSLCSHFSEAIVSYFNHQEYRREHPEYAGSYIEATVLDELGKRGLAVLNSNHAVEWHLSKFCELIMIDLRQSICKDIDESN